MLKEQKKLIAIQLSELIDRHVCSLTKEDTKWKEMYDSVMSELETEIQVTEQIIADFTESKLTINTVEQEGYLRCLKTMVNRFRDWENF